MGISRGTHAGKFTKACQKNRLNLSLIYDAEHSVILTELQSALRLSTHLSPHSLAFSTHSPPPHIGGASNYRHSVGTCLRHVSVATTKYHALETCRRHVPTFGRNHFSARIQVRMGGGGGTKKPLAFQAKG